MSYYANKYTKKLKINIYFIDLSINNKKLKD